MPLYAYQCTDGHVSNKRFLMADRKPRTIRCMAPGCKKRARRFFRNINVRPPSNWPIKSDAVGVAPHQVKEAEEHSQKIGIPTHFTKDGRAILESPEHRKAYCEAIGMFDRNAGYNDPLPSGKLNEDASHVEYFD